jgi:hypothetical protein
MESEKFKALIQEIEHKGKEEQEKIKKSIILTKIEINLNNPAISQLKVRLGEELEKQFPQLIVKIHKDCEDFIESRFNSVNSKVDLIKESEILIEAKETKFMYRLLEGVLNLIKENYGDRFNIKIEGSWTKW